MKRYSNLYQSVCDINNIKRAIVNASKEKQNRKSVIKVLDDIDGHAEKLQKMLINREYIPSEYITMTIFDGSRRKERVISKPRFFPDQCIHWSLMQIVEPLFFKRMYKFSCASMKGRGIHYAKNYVKGALKDKKKTKYAYQLDIRKFYPSIDNEQLKMKLRKMFKDDGILWLFDTIIDSAEGLPIGNYTSQWLANFYLDDLDNFIKHTLKVRYYVRYADDILIFSPNKRKLRRDRMLIERFIKNENLTIKPNWKIFKVDSRPIDFVGFRYYRNRITIRDNMFLRIKRRAKRIGKKPCISVHDARSMTSYWGYVKHSNSYGAYMKYIHPYCSISKCKEIIKNDAKIHNQINKQIHNQRSA